MPYLTSYSLEIKRPDDDTPESGEPQNSSQADQGGLPTIREVAEYLAPFAKPTVRSGYSPENGEDIYWTRILDSESETNWPHRQEEMARVSLNWPGVLFEITGEGEDAISDSWREYYLDGKVHQVFGEMSYPDFEPDGLINPEVLPEILKEGEGDQ